LRHLLYPGDVAWTEEGHRFSWRMKLRDKSGSVQLRVRDSVTGKEWIDSLDELTKRQRRKMATHPDMLLQYAHHLARRHAAEGRTVEVYAAAEVSLNGREQQLLVDPGVDLSKEPRNLWPASWILPFDRAARTGVAGEEPPQFESDD
jgi:hypothetical protein